MGGKCGVLEALFLTVDFQAKSLFFVLQLNHYVSVSPSLTPTQTEVVLLFLCCHGTLRIHPSPNNHTPQQWFSNHGPQIPRVLEALLRGGHEVKTICIML